MVVMFINIALAAIAIGLLILVHELGHFLAAKAVGVRVETFSIGFWKKIVGFTKGDTEYRLSLIPLGGYVKLAGEMEGEGSGAPDEFCSKSPGARAFVLVAGVSMNVLFALLAFILAFSIGVPFEVAEVGRVEKGSPAWEAGMMPGDRITRVHDIQDPDFQDLQRQVALMGHDSISLTVQRNGEEHVFEIVPRYDEMAGMRLIGFAPPVEPVVSGLTRIESEPEQPRSPAIEAGVKLGDRILSVNGKEIDYFRHLQDVLGKHENGAIELELLRGAETLKVEVEPVRPPRYVIGISGVGTRIEALQARGPAWRAGLQSGDRIIAINDSPVQNLTDIEKTIEGAFGPIRITAERNGEKRHFERDISGRKELDTFMYSFTTRSSNQLSWVERDGPAWEAGMRAGDVIKAVNNNSVSTWQEILEANRQAGRAPRTVRWERNGDIRTAELEPIKSFDDQPAQIGALFNRTKTQVRQEGVLGAVSTGVKKTYGAFADMIFTMRGFATRDVSTQHVGGIVLIAYASYHAAARGLGQLLYFSAMISAALAFLNILPIPVLDGGHLLFVGIEKIKGKPVSERARAISQAVGLSLLLLLVVYAIRNDILRLIS